MKIDFDSLPQITAPQPVLQPVSPVVSGDTLNLQTIATMPLVEASVAFVGQMQANSRVISGYQKAGLLIREVTAATVSYAHILGGKITTTATTNVQLGKSERDPTKAALLRSNMRAQLVDQFVTSDSGKLSDQEYLFAAQSICTDKSVKPLAPNSDPHAILLPELSQSWWISPSHENADWYGTQVRPLISAGTKYLIIAYPGSVKTGPQSINSFYRVGLAVKAETPVIYEQQLLPGVFGNVLLSKNSLRMSVSMLPIYCPRDVHTAQLLTNGWTLVESTPTIAVWKISTLEQSTVSGLNAAEYASNSLVETDSTEVLELQSQ